MVTATIVGVSSANSGTAAANNLTIPLVTGWAAGDLLVAKWMTNPSTQVFNTKPAGWTQLRDSTAGNGRVYLAWRWAVGGMAAPQVIGSASNQWAGEMIALRGVDTTTPFHSVQQTNGTASATVTFAGITPTAVDDLLMYVVGARSSVNTTAVSFTTNPAGGTGGTVTKRVEDSSTRASNPNVGVGLWTQALSATTAVPSRTCTVSPTSLSIVETFVIHAAPAGGTTVNLTAVGTGGGSGVATVKRTVSLSAAGSGGGSGTATVKRVVSLTGSGSGGGSGQATVKRTVHFTNGSIYGEGVYGEGVYGEGRNTGTGSGTATVTVTSGEPTETTVDLTATGSGGGSGQASLRRVVSLSATGQGGGSGEATTKRTVNLSNGLIYGEGVYGEGVYGEWRNTGTGSGQATLRHVVRLTASGTGSGEGVATVRTLVSTPTPAVRTLTVPAEVRTLTVTADNRVHVVAAQHRTLTVPAENRTRAIPADNRTLTA